MLSAPSADNDRRGSNFWFSWQSCIEIGDSGVWYVCLCVRVCAYPRRPASQASQAPPASPYSQRRYLLSFKSDPENTAIEDRLDEVWTGYNNIDFITVAQVIILKVVIIIGGDLY